jgi:hypothetical protein
MSASLGYAQQGALRQGIALVQIGQALRPLPGGEVRVCVETASGTPCTPLAHVYSNIGLSTEILPQGTVPVDANGNYYYYANINDLYQEQVSGAGVATLTTDNIALPWSGTVSLAGNNTWTGGNTFSLEVVFGNGGWALPESTTTSGASNYDLCAGSSSLHALICSYNAATARPVSLLKVFQCGTLAACSASQEVGLGQIVTGTVAFSSSTTVSITGMPAFSGATTYTCALFDPTHSYTWLVTAQTTTGFTLTAGTSNSDTWTYSCIGY